MIHVGAVTFNNGETELIIEDSETCEQLMIKLPKHLSGVEVEKLQQILPPCVYVKANVNLKQSIERVLNSTRKAKYARKYELCVDDYLLKGLQKELERAEQEDKERQKIFDDMWLAIKEVYTKHSSPIQFHDKFGSTTSILREVMYKASSFITAETKKFCCDCDKI